MLIGDLIGLGVIFRSPNRVEAIGRNLVSAVVFGDVLYRVAVTIGVRTKTAAHSTTMAVMMGCLVKSHTVVARSSAMLSATEKTRQR